MREGKPSFTAAAVAAARAVAGVDPLAPALVDGALSLVTRVGRAGRAPAAMINVATLGLVDHIEMRTRAIDAALRTAVDAGVRQLVTLGAGLDARAWRMPELAEVRAFEVDHPSTQAFKRERMGERAAKAREVRFVAVDFARDSLEEALARAGHDADAPTFWLWEGVTPYLPREAVRATLAAVAGRSAPASRVAVTYGTPAASPLGPAAVRVALAGFRVIGEAIVGLITREAMHAELAAVGYRVIDDVSAREWGERHGGARRRLLLVEERLAVAITDGRPRASRAA
ncbi:MAG TPA: SAM-dependent methyltransferase [Polyangiaceae bacterium]|jgi:methyltransferase (TIGR00027 family)